MRGGGARGGFAGHGGELGFIRVALAWLEHEVGRFRTGLECVEVHVGGLGWKVSGG